MSKSKNHDRVWKRYREVIYECVRDGRAQRLSSGPRITEEDEAVTWSDPRNREWSTVSTVFGEQEKLFVQLKSRGLTDRQAATRVLSEIPGITYRPPVFWDLLRVAGPHQSWALSSRGFSRLCRIILKDDPRFLQEPDGSWRVIPDVLACALQSTSDVQPVPIRVQLPAASGTALNVTWPAEAAVLRQEALSFAQRTGRMGSAGYGALISRLLLKFGPVAAEGEQATPMEVAEMMLSAAAGDERVLQEVSTLMKEIHERNEQ